jgi:DNA-binding NtrC family response regulator
MAGSPAILPGTMSKPVDILILDDDTDLLASAADLLSDEGYRVKAFADAESALAFAMNENFALGIFDYRLGSLKSGLDVVEKMQALGLKATYVLVTADVEKATQLRALHLNIFEFLKKPVEPAALLATVARGLRRAARAAA